MTLVPRWQVCLWGNKLLENVYVWSPLPAQIIFFTLFFQIQVIFAITFVNPDFFSSRKVSESVQSLEYLRIVILVKLSFKVFMLILRMSPQHVVCVRSWQTSSYFQHCRQKEAVVAYLNMLPSSSTTLHNVHIWMKYEPKCGTKTRIFSMSFSLIYFNAFDLQRICLKIHGLQGLPRALNI